MDVFDKLELIVIAVGITVLYVEFDKIKRLLRKKNVTR